MKPALAADRSRWASVTVIAFSVGALTLLQCALTAQASGPFVHIREGARTFELLKEQKHPLAQTLEGTDALPFVQIGAIFPDLQLVLKSIKKGTHSWALGKFLVENAKGEAFWKQAMALGFLIHIASDASAESMFTPYYNIKSALGPVDVLRGTDDQRGEGEMELWVEFLNEFYNGDTDAGLTLLDQFISNPQPAPSPYNMGVLVTHFCQQANLYFSGQFGDCDEMVAELNQTLGKATAAIDDFGLANAKALLQAARGLPPSAIVELLLNSNGSGISSILSAFGLNVGGDLDGVQWLRFKNSEMMSSATFFADYGTLFATLGPWFAYENLLGDSVNGDWPRYRGTNIIAGNIQGLVGHLDPATNQQNAGQLVYDLRFEDPLTGNALTEIDAKNAPASVRVRLQLVNLRHESAAITLRVLADRPGFDQGQDPLVASTTATISHDPQRYVTTQVFEIVLTFDPRPHLSHLGFYVDLQKEGKRFFSSSWDPFETLSTVDTQRPFVRRFYSTYEHWPRSLKILGGSIGDAWGRVVLAVRPPQGCPGVEGVQIRRVDGTLLAEHHPLGNYAFDGLPSQVLSFVVSAPLFQAQTVSATPSNPHLPTPLDVDLSWSGTLFAQVAPLYTDGKQLVVALPKTLFTVSPKSLRLSAGSAPGKTDLLDWANFTLADNAPPPTLTFAEPLPHGSDVYLNAEAVYFAPEVCVLGSSHKIGVDLTPPAPPNATVVEGPSDQNQFSVTLAISAADPESAITSYKIAIDGCPAVGEKTVSPATPLTLSLSACVTTSTSSLALLLRATNGAGATSEPASISVDVTRHFDTPPDEDADATDATGIDAATDGANAPAQSGGTLSGGGCQSLRTGAPNLWLPWLLGLALVVCRRRRRSEAEP